eukprot:gb/GFBE01075404.1/.p1 GENE.gb/GFBE01075404.1/~~gb/GFBE01075404.1/.p1  ORF type:complete len:207 (+),score=67.17 gb/GFBE01075404.1/:1-621(+)
MAKGRQQKRPRDPEQPKKLVGGAYGIFVDENREEMMKSLPAGSKFTDMAKVASSRWKEMSEEDKAPYQKKYEAKKEEYDAAMKKYQETRSQDADADAAVEETATPSKRHRKADDAVVPSSAEKQTQQKVVSAKRSGNKGPQELAKEVNRRRSLHARAQRLGLLPKMLELSQEQEIVAKRLNETKVLKALETSAGIVDLARSKLLAA